MKRAVAIGLLPLSFLMAGVSHSSESTTVALSRSDGKVASRVTYSLDAQTAVVDPPRRIVNCWSLDVPRKLRKSLRSAVDASHPEEWTHRRSESGPLSCGGGRTVVTLLVKSSAHYDVEWCGDPPADLSDDFRAVYDALEAIEAKAIPACEAMPTPTPHKEPRR